MDTLTIAQAEELEAEMRRLEADPEVSKRDLRLFMQTPMPCGHAVGNLLTCPDPPFGCVTCLTSSAQRDALLAAKRIFDKGTANVSDGEWDEVAGKVYAAIEAMGLNEVAPTAV